MTHHRRRLFEAAVLLLLVLAGCSNTKPCTNQNLTVSAPVVGTSLYPRCHGRCVRVSACLNPHGSRIEQLRVLVTSEDGTPASEPPTVRVVGGPRVQAVTTDGNAAVVWFCPPGPCDGIVSMMVTIPEASPCPYRIRLVPVFRAP
jgi:hypothetical protein